MKPERRLSVDVKFSICTIAIGIFIAPPKEVFIRTNTFNPPIYRIEYHIYVHPLPFVAIRFIYRRGDLKNVQDERFSPNSLHSSEPV